MHDVGIGIQAHQVVRIGHGEPAQHQPVRLKEHLHRPVLPTRSRYLRHDILMTMKPLPLERITSIVDDLFLPLATGMPR